MPLPEQYWQFAPVSKMVCTNCVCSGALTVQPLAALPFYGCGAPLAGIERLVRDNSTAEGRWCTPRHPDVSLRERSDGNLEEVRFRRNSCYPALYCEIGRRPLASSQ